MPSVLETLKERGFVQQCTDEPGLDKLLAEKSIPLYCGFDPTAPSLHMGNLVQLVTARRLQNAGHDLWHQPMPDFDVLAADDRDIDFIAGPPVRDQLAGATDAGVAAPENQDPLATHDQRARPSAFRAAYTPHMPCTPPPGGVDDEQR